MTFSLLTVALVVGVVGPSEEPAWATSDQATSVKVGPDAFLAGMYVEAGVKENGSFGSSSAAPAGFHPQPGPTGKLGFVAVRDTAQSSWSAASAAGLVDGDFFVPGSPYEGWALKVGSVVGSNYHSATDIPGSLGSVTNATGTSGNNTVSWSSTAPFQGVTIAKTYSLPQAGQRVDVSVTLTNTTGAPITDIYYGRGVDPDDGNSTSDPYTSTNTIVSQINEGGSSSRVSAAFGRGAQIFLDSTDPRSRVAREDNDFTADFDPQAVWDGSGVFLGTVSNSATEDAGINLAVKVDSLAPGESSTLTFSYLLTASAAGGGSSSGGGGAAVGEPELPADPRLALDFRGRAGQPSEGAVVDVSGLSVPAGAVATVSLCAPEVKLFEEVSTGGAFDRAVALPAGLAPGSSTVVYQVLLPSGEVLALNVVVEIGDGGVITSVSENVVGLPSSGACGDISALADTGVRSSSLPWWAIITIFGGLMLILYSRRAVKMAEAFDARLDENGHRTPWEILSTPIR
ncbi:MAG: hypothetical protein F2556_06330, partial [Actinobacteria bacterium]|nr:hypothetical protein [Actinomycetota bacterium]